MKKVQADIIVVGAGHAGMEAAFVCSRLGHKVLLLTTNTNRLSFMSCNPAIGGLAKGHIVREIEALGGKMSEAADASCLQFKRLNQRKGPAVRGRRMQCDKSVYSKTMQDFLLKDPRILLKEAEVKKIRVKSNKCLGVVLKDGSFISSHAVLITTGTFMGACMHVGKKLQAGGRLGDKASVGLSDQLRELGFNVHRLKTGTPPRIHKNSINFEKTERQSGDANFLPFSVLSPKTPKLKQLDCYLTYTNEKTHEIIRSQLKNSPLFQGIIQATGPRYCPSVEDKIFSF